MKLGIYKVGIYPEFIFVVSTSLSAAVKEWEKRFEKGPNYVEDLSEDRPVIYIKP